jgi:acyl-coenzyme A synthetase/AMP-(fatty) acid ligase
MGTRCSAGCDEGGENLSSAIAFVDALPRTDTGQLRRTALRAIAAGETPG